MALVLSVMFLLLTSVLAATFMLTASGERSLSSNVHIAKGSLYSADAGVRVAQQVLGNMARTKLDSLAAIWPGPGNPIINQPNNLFPAGSTIVNGTLPNFTSSALVAFSDSDLTDTSQVYNYLCTVTATGKFGVFGQRRVQSQSVLRVSASRGSFADYLLFTNTHLMPGGGQIWFTASTYFDGRVHTNTQFRFAYTPQFQDLVTQVNTKAWYYNKGSPKQLAANNNGSVDVPNFYGGFTRGAPSVTLPPNSFGQQNAALGLVPDPVAPTNSIINAQLGTGAGTSTPPNGVYVVHSGATMTGGLYVQGTLDQCVMNLDGSGRQVYTMKQGSATTTVTLDRSTNQTIVTTGSGTTTYTGMPRGVVYVNGQISDLRGPDRAGAVIPPAIDGDNQLLVAATGDIILQRDITCDDFNNSSGVLGIFSSGGSVRVGTSAPNDMHLDAFVMATGTNGAFSVDNYSTGSPRGTFNLRGGAVTSYYGGFFTFNVAGVLQTGYARDFHYDRRGLVPPYFPTTDRFTSDRPTARTIIWKEV